jgi:hypothetical protein
MGLFAMFEASMSEFDGRELNTGYLRAQDSLQYSLQSAT